MSGLTALIIFLISILVIIVLAIVVTTYMDKRGREKEEAKLASVFKIGELVYYPVEFENHIIIRLAPIVEIRVYRDGLKYLVNHPVTGGETTKLVFKTCNEAADAMTKKILEADEDKLVTF